MSRRKLYIIGARGGGREMVGTLRLWPGFLDQYEIAGFLDGKAPALDGFEGYPPIVSAPEDFQPKEEDVLLCSLGDVYWHRFYIDMMLAKGGRFGTFVSPTAIIHGTAAIGQGCFVGAFTTLSSNTRVADFVHFHPYCDIGHDVEIGPYTMVETYTFCGGSVKIGREVTLHTRATILPRIKVGDMATVGAGSVVLRSVSAGITVFGNPARKVEF